MLQYHIVALLFTVQFLVSRSISSGKSVIFSDTSATGNDLTENK